MFHTSTPSNHGILFFFDLPKKRQFWMKNTHIYLDIFWINKDKQVVQIDRSVPPETIDFVATIPCLLPIMYVLEIPSGSPISQNISLYDFLSWVPITDSLLLND